MKLIVFTLLTILTTNIFARSGVITIVDENGNEAHYDRKDWAVVRFPFKPRKKTKAPLCKPNVQWKTRPSSTVVAQKPVRVDRVVFKKNKFNLLGGYGPIGLDTTRTAGTQNIYSVKKEYGPILGLGYTRSFNPIWSVGLEGFTNYSVLGNLGYSW